MVNMIILACLFVTSFIHGEGFIQGTLIKTRDNGYKPIEQVEANEYVFALDADKNLVSTRVEAVLGRYQSHWCIISLDGIKITAESTQKFYHAEKEAWVEAKDLVIGDILLEACGYKKIVSDEIVHVKRDIYSYSLYLDKYHNFCVTEHDILAHNVIPLLVWGVGGIAFAGWDAVAAGTVYTLGAIAFGWGVNKAMRNMGASGSVDYQDLFEAARKIPPGYNDDWVKRRGRPGFIDPDGNIWTPDMKHRNPGPRNIGPHWDVSDPDGNKIREVNDDGKQIWPDGPKNKNT